jgi:LysR family transcriptional regulator, benzoate and cis,cis-muconate-responsive activator of ben and cat genes
MPPGGVALASLAPPGYPGVVELRHLRTFLAVAEELHFGTAADRLFLSPPAVTEHIRALERETGVALFERGRVIRLTDAGTMLVDHARQAVAHADAAMEALRQFSTGEAGHLRIGILSNGAGSLTASIIRSFMIAHPRARVTVRRLNYRDYLAVLTGHRVDAAFVRPDPGDERFHTIRLSAEPRVAVLPAAHRLADATEIAVGDVLNEPFVSITSDIHASFADYVYLRSQRGGLAPRTVETGCADAIDVLAAVSAGRGIASAVESFRGYENWPGVSYVSLSGAEPAANVLISRRDDPSLLVRAFARLAEAVSGVPDSRPPPAGDISADVPQGWPRERSRRHS